MFELLVCLTTPPMDDPYHYARHYKRGDMIVYQGASWAAGELTNPDWRILRFEAASEADIQALASAELATGDGRATLNVRGFYLDLDAIADQAFQTYLADNTRAQPSFTLAATIESVKKRRDPVRDPAVIG